MTVFPAHRKKKIIPIFRCSEEVSFYPPQPLSGFFFDCLPCARHFAGHWMYSDEQWVVTVPISYPLEGKKANLIKQIIMDQPHVMCIGITEHRNTNTYE